MNYDEAPVKDINKIVHGECTYGLMSDGECLIETKDQARTEQAWVTL